MIQPATTRVVHPETVVSVKGLKFAWSKNESPVIDIDEFSAGSGERTFLHGASGSGKTTLLSILGGVATQNAGSVHVAGTDLSSLTSSQRDQFRADNVGFIFQMFNLVPYLSLTKNVGLPCWFSNQRRERATRDRSLEEESERLLRHLGLTGEIINRPAAALSVGQQQRVAAARALIGSPAIIIADEPTSALDTDSRELFIELLFKESERANTTVLFVSHDQSLAHLFDRSIDLAQINKASAGT